MHNLQKFAGVSAICEAIIYIAAFVYFGAYWSFPSEGSALEKMTYLAEHQLLFSCVYFVIYVVFGVLLAVLGVGLNEKLQTNNALVKIGSVFGFVWVVLVIASGMLANIGLNHALSLMEINSEKAFELWRIVSVLVESLGGGNELVGGLWVLLISIAALQAKVFSKGLNYLGLVVGTAGIATVYPEQLFTEIFGVTQIIWFSWLGLVMFSQSHASKVIQPVTKTLTD